MARDIRCRNGVIRPLGPDDFEAVVALDSANTGQSRRGFFDKRLKAALDEPGDYVYVGLHDGGRLIAFALASLIEGEFGQPGRRGLLDVIGVAPGHQNRGAGGDLLAAVRDILRHKGAIALETQVDWSDRHLLGFFGSAGFRLAPRMILGRSMADPLPQDTPDDDLQDGIEIDFSTPDGDEPGALSSDRIPVRSMEAADLDAIIRIDRRLSGSDRRAYFERKLREVTVESGIRVSLVAEMEGFVVGYIMARVDFGAFGHMVSEAVMDTIGVDPGYKGQGVGHALLARLVSNLGVLRVDSLRSEVAWNDVEVIAFLGHAGFQPTQRLSLISDLQAL